MKRRHFIKTKSGLRSSSSRARTCCNQLTLTRNHTFWSHRTLTGVWQQ